MEDNFTDYHKNKPVNAKERLVQIYLLESWPMYDPDMVFDWIVKYGDGMMMNLLPLAFSQMDHSNIQLFKDGLGKIPHEDIYNRCLLLVDLESKK